MKNPSISLSDTFIEFIDELIQSGRYETASEVIREGLRILQDRERRNEGLRMAMKEGKKSGVDQKFDPHTFIEEMHKKYLAE